jgi:uncharacterized DUF497 family protein
MKISDFDWNEGNWPKCGKHGVGRAEIEELFETDLSVFPAAQATGFEQRLIAIGFNRAGRAILVVFVFRLRNGNVLIRPISARFIHTKEHRHYEGQIVSTEETADPEE